MKTDRELLELAAKAGDIKGKWCSRSGAVRILTCDGLTDRYWNPLEDGGDALRLAVKLHISVNQNIFDVGVCTINLALAGIFIKEECRNQDRLTATCRAITIAAAAIGEGME